MSRQYWGPYCPLPLIKKPYVEVVYPCSYGFILAPDGSLQELEQEEMDARAEQHRALLARSLRDTWEEGL